METEIQPSEDDKFVRQADASSSSRIARFLRLLITGGCLGFLTFLLLLYVFVQDRYWWSEYFTIWPSFLWLFPVVPPAMLGVSRKTWKYSAAFAATVVLFLLLTIEWRPLLRTSNAAGEPTLRLVTWNVLNAPHHVIESVFNEVGADIMFIQESPDDPTTVPSGLHWYDSGDCATLSRFPLQPVAGRSVGPWPDPQLMLLQRGTGTSVLLINAHMMLPALVLNPLNRGQRHKLRNDHGARLRQFEELARLVAEKSRLTSHTILAGDLNTPGGIYSLRPLDRKLRDVWPKCGRGWGGTMTADFPVSRIDHCWISRDIKCTSARVLKHANDSDHRMLIVDLQI